MTDIHSICVERLAGFRVVYRKNGIIPLRCGPFFEEQEHAIRVAAALSRALRECGLQMEPVVILPNAQPLVEAIEEEIQMNLEVFYDDPEPGLDLSILQSIELSADGSVALAYDQAWEVSELMSTIIETEEDGEPNLAICATLRQHARQLELAGFPFTVYNIPDYSVHLADLPEPPRPYEVYYKGELLGASELLGDTYPIINKHRGPAVGSQLKLEES